MPNNQPLNIGIYKKEVPIKIMKKKPQNTKSSLLGRREAASSTSQLQDEFYPKTFNSRKVDDAIKKLPAEVYEFYANKTKEQFRNEFLLEGPRVQEAIDTKVRLLNERRVKHE